MSIVQDAAPASAILSKLHHVKAVSGGWIASCPVPTHGKGNGDRHPSLSISEGEDGRVLLNCRAGCETSAVVESLGLNMTDLFVNTVPSESIPRRRSSSGRQVPANTSVAPMISDVTTARRTDDGDSSAQAVSGFSLADYAHAKRLPETFLESVGVTNGKFNKHAVVRIAYLNADGTEGAIRYRVALEKPPGGGDRFRWAKGTKVRLYGLDRLPQARNAGYVFLVEGESCANTCWYTGVPAVGVAGANNYRDDRDAQHLAEIAVIYAVIEPDASGEALRKRLATSSIRDRVYFVDLSPFGVKDLSALYLDDPTRFHERIAEVKASATACSELEAHAHEEVSAGAFEIARDLLNHPDILNEVRASMRSRGYAGKLDPAIHAYIAITSRLLPTPLNLAFIAPSGAGKNRTVDEARAHIPEDAVYEIKAGSDRALIYNDASFEHRVVFFSEADSIPEDGAAASAVRNIASDNEMTYEVVERDEQTGKFQTRRIVKPGPTSLITTSTKSLQHQFDTRVLEITIPDDAEQTRAVMRAHARAVTQSENDSVDISRFLALQQWIEFAGVHDVQVPYAAALAELLPTGDVRMRRDFRQLLTYIQTIALLHQCQRERTSDARIIATLDDYAVARSLCLPIFDIAISGGVTQEIRAAVHAISECEEVSISQLAERMHIARTTVQYRVTRACKGGWIVNNETIKGKPAKLVRGVPLPDAVEALPTVDQLREAPRQADEAQPSIGDVVRHAASPVMAYENMGHDDLTNPTGELLTNGQALPTNSVETDDYFEEEI